MSAPTDSAPTLERATKATQLDRRPIAPRELVQHVREAHGLPRRRAEWIARQCYRDPRTAAAYLPLGWVEMLHPTVTTYRRRIPRMVGTGETGRMDFPGGAAA
ncbi:hypothetical protein KZX06_09485 [Micrococcus sp. EYE_162]|uniref:hypothetical protein n=1 Tax=unclassified Micrococcus TaxID=2620948 RepID=UPI0020043E22|nr:MULTISPECIES: hypothetical protein [unclassified Micrococcus]MCK6096159.1 hypothetical protein [Micrococcus sp. EYE_212]MCK6172250.1 hypothetical protein [Micrococcus sp. EYE_162]